MSHEESMQAAQQRNPARTPGWVWVIVGIGGGFLLLIFIGIIAAIAIPNLLVAKDKVAVRKTVQDMKALSVAMETYAIDHGQYPAASTADELAAILQQAQCGTNLPVRDAWGHPFFVEVRSDAARYCIISAGQNGLREAEEPYSGLPQENPERGADIVFIDGRLVSGPAGADR